MLKKLTDEQLDQILETGISEFSKLGMEKANINVIAKKAGISVGVLYKYYSDKETFFFACLEKSLKVLEEVIEEFLDPNEKILDKAKRVIEAVSFYAKKYPSYMIMYHEITSGSFREYAPVLADKIERISANAYSKYIQSAIDSFDIRTDIDARSFAFFFDNLLMMMQFSYSCDYYKERMKIYVGEDTPDDFIKEQLLKFLESAFTFQKK